MKNQKPKTKLKLTTYFKPYLFLICLSLLLFSCDTDEVIEESALEETQEDNTPSISVRTIDFTEISINDKVLEKIEYLKERNDKYNTLSREIQNEEYEFSFNTDYVKYIEYGDYHSYSFPLTRNEPENDNLENLFLSLNNEGEYDAFIVKYDFTAEELLDLTEEELNNSTTQYIPIDIDTSFLGSDNTATRYICVQAWDYVDCTLGWFHGDGSSCEPGWVSYWDCTWVGGSGTGSAPGTGDNTSSGGDNTDGGGGATGSGDQGDIYYYITAPTVIPMSQQLTTFLGQLTPEQEAWADGLGSRKAQELLDYLLHCGVTAEGRDCEVDTDFALLALDANIEGAEVDYVNKIVLDPTFINNQKMKCIYDKLKEISGSYFKEITEELFESSKESHLFFTVESLDGNDAFTMPAILSNGNRAYQIIIDPDFINDSSLLLIAQTLIHEIMHAEIIERLAQLEIINITEDYDVEFITAEYSIYNGIEDLNKQSIIIYSETFMQNEQWAHELFNLEFYRDKLIDNLGEFHNSIEDASFLTQVTNMGWELGTESGMYSALSWNGLRNTSNYESIDVSIRNLILQQIVFTKDFSNGNCN